MRLQVFINDSLVFEDRLKEDDEFSFIVGKGDASAYAKFTEEAMLKFDEARKFYPGKKLGNPTEFLNYRHRHRDWKESLPLLIPAINSQIEERKRLKYAGKFVPEWKNFKTWINNRCWEEEIAPPVKQAVIPNMMTFQKP